MPNTINEDIAGRLDEVARILAEQGANRFRVQAYHQGASVLRGLARPVAEIFAEEGMAGLGKLPGAGKSITRAIQDIPRHGKLAMLAPLRCDHDPIALLTSARGPASRRGGAGVGLSRRIASHCCTPPAHRHSDRRRATDRLSAPLALGSSR